MKFLCIFMILALGLVMGTWAAVSEPESSDAVEPQQQEIGPVDEKKTEKRGIYGFGYGHGGYGAYGGYGGYGHGHYGGYPYYGGGFGYVPYYGGHHGYYPYHHGHYGFY